METKILPAHDKDAVATAAALLRAGELVAFPTETVYGLGANALSREAVLKIYAAKDRPADNPLIVHIADPAEVDQYATNISDHARALIAHFWPGPLSLVLNKRSVIPDATTANLPTVVLRCPSHPVARALIRAAGVPIAAPSANRSGRVSTTEAAHVYEDLAGRIPLILDGGPVEVGLESTVVDCTGSTPLLLRPGLITRELLEAVVGAMDTEAPNSPTPLSPGMKYRHYAPRAPLTLFTGANSAAAISEATSKEPPTALAIIHHTPLKVPSGVKTFTLPANPVAAATLLFSTLRAADAAGAARIFIEGYPEEGAGAAIMNRLRKAATTTIET